MSQQHPEAETPKPRLDPRDEIVVGGSHNDVNVQAVIAPILRRATESPILPSSAPSSAALSSHLPSELPSSGVALETVLTEVDSVAVRLHRRNAHPGFFGYVCSPGLPTDPLSHALVAALNQNLISSVTTPGPAAVERTVLDWMRMLSGFPEETTEGAIVSCGSIANLSGIAVALYSKIGCQYLHEGMVHYHGGVPVILVSSMAHFSMRRAAVLLGMGTRQVLSVNHDEQFRMDPEHLVEVLDECERRGQVPVCVVGTAGTTLTGSIDPLDAIADICASRNIWFHVDAAYGGAGLLSDKLKSRFRGIERADSLCMDLHKWFYIGFDGSVLLYRNPERARQVFFTQADYIPLPKSEDLIFWHLCPELSRRFRALPAYVALRHYGSDRLGRNVQHNHDCAVYLARLVEEANDFELMNEPELSVCCFRYVPLGLSHDAAASIDALNDYIRTRLEKEGNFYMSTSLLLGRPVLRVCICSHTTRAEHIDALVDSVRNIGRERVFGGS